MRFVVFGAGAIGGVVGARLHESGADVTLIARGAHHDAIARDGLTLVTPVQRSVFPIDVAAGPAGIDWSDDDVVLLATKSQDTLGALSALRAAAGPGVPVVCLQNGVENERLALRLMDQVYAAVVMCPAAHLEPGVVEAYGTRLTGTLDLGRYPDGVDDQSRAICQALAGARFQSTPTPDVMRHKYAKLLLNLGNAVEALCEPGEATHDLIERAQAEGRDALTAASIPHVADEVSDIATRWREWGVEAIEGRERAGSSSWQSLARGTGTIETDYLNGEIVLLGRLHGVPTPVNESVCRLATTAAGERRPPRSVSPSEILAVTA